jgi:ectoine hydroxylase-related dioxygenase (phytanoyl-CoA dioxygenase family)
MRKLTQDEIRKYEEDGFVVLADFFPKAEMSEMLQEITELEQSGKLSTKKEADHQGYIFQLATLTEKTKSFASDDRILDVLEDIVYPGISIYSSKLVSKLPFNDTVCHWHQDDAYYHKVGESSVRMSIWVPLTEATLDNGCLWVVPGSHKLGLQPFQARKDGSCRLALIEEQVDLSKAIPLEVEAGSLVLFSALLWHGSKGNQTDSIRRAFIVSYQEATITQGNGKQWTILRPAAQGTA